MLEISLYRGARDPVPERQDDFADWPELVANLHELVDDEAPATPEAPDGDKTRLYAFAPHALRVPYRITENVAHVSCLAIDVDTCDLDALDVRLRALACDALVYGTPSDDASGAPDARRVRVVAPVSRPIAPSECAATRLAFAEALGLAPGRGIEACLDAARINFVGRMPGAPPREWRTYAGGPVDVDALLARPLAHAWGAPTAAPVTEPTASPGVASDPHALATSATLASCLALLGDAHDHDGRKHDLCGALGGVMRRAGYSREDCATLIRAWLPAGEASVDVEAGVRWALGAWDGPASAVSGEGALRAIVGAERARMIANALSMRMGLRQCALDEGVVAAPANGSALAAFGRFWDRTKPPPRLNYVVDAFDFAPGKVSVIQGYGNTAKTPFALLLGLCIASGRDFLGCAVQQGPVLYLAFEGGVLTEEREARLCAGLGLRREEISTFEGITLGEDLGEAMLDALESHIREHDIRVAFVDTYGSAVAGEVDQNASTFSHYLKELGRLSDATGCLIVVLLHENKGESDGLRRISGHNSLAGAIQASISLTRKDEDRNVLRVTCTRETRKAFEPFDVKFCDVEMAEAPRGSALTAERSSGSTVASRWSANETRANDRRRSMTLAGSRMLTYMRSNGVRVAFDTKSLNEVAGDTGVNNQKEARARLAKHGLIESAPGGLGYQLTERGREADDQTVLGALADGVMGFTR